MSRQPKVSPEKTSAPVAPDETLFERVGRYLASNEWKYTAHKGNEFYELGFRIPDCHLRIIVDVMETEDLNRILVYSTYPVFATEAKRLSVLEAMNQINYSLATGNFEMDPEDGEIRVRTNVESTTPLSEGLVERALGINIHLANTHFAAIMAAIYGDASAETKQALEERKTETLQ